MEVQVFSSISEAELFPVESGKFYFIKDEEINLDTLTENWEECKASSVPHEIKTNERYQKGVLVKVTERKTKFFCLSRKKSLCTETCYSYAIKSLL